MRYAKGHRRLLAAIEFVPLVDGFVPSETLFVHLNVSSACPAGNTRGSKGIRRGTIGISPARAEIRTAIVRRPLAPS
jgi:hypothetical protein